MAQSLTLRARGLYTFPNSLSEIPEGSLVQADNVVIDREGVISPRRGFAIYGSSFGASTDRTKQLMTYKGRVLRHWANTLDYDSDGAGTFVTLSSSVTEVSTGTRIRYVEANGNFFFTTNAGMMKISASSTAGLSTASVTNAGGVKALDGVAALNSQVGFFTQDSRVAYRVVWGIRDANNNVVMGVPSQRIVVDNPLLSLIINDFNNLLKNLDTAAAADPNDSLKNTDYYSTLRVSVNSSATTLLTAMKALANGTTNKLDTDLTGTTFQSIAAPAAPSNPATTAQLVNIQTYYDNIVNAANTHPGISTTAKNAIGGAFANSTQSSTVKLTFTVPSNATTAHFYQVYRSALATSTGSTTINDVAPDDELRLVYEGNPASADITARSITYNDIVPQTFRDNGANLYTNANSGEGILQANEAPPLAKDVALFKGYTFYANTQTRHKKTIALLTAQGLNGATFTVTQSGVNTTFNFVNKVQQVVNVTCVAGNLYTATGSADYFDISTANNTTVYRVWFSVGTAVAPASGGNTLVQCTIASADTNAQVATKLKTALQAISGFLSTVSTNVVTVTNEGYGYANNPVNGVVNAGFSVAVTTSGSGERASTQSVVVSNAATPAQQVDESARSLVRVINQQASSPIMASYISGPSDVPGQILLEAATISAAQFTLTSSYGSAFNPTLPSSGTSIASDNEVAPNRIYFSKYQQPEAVPIVNYRDVGPKDKKIQRILPLRDSLFILSEGGVYRLSGDVASNFTVTLFDGTTKILASDTASVLNNQVYMLADQGVVAISDTGVSVISRPIEDLLRSLPLYANFKSASFAVSYDTDRSYLLWTVKNSADTVATQCFRFNTFTNTWVTWSLSKTCAVVPPELNILYLGASDINSIEQERKSYTRFDHADRSTTLSVQVNGVNGTTVNPVTTQGANTGDVLVQTQYLTISQFNRLLTSLDRDSGLSLKTYKSSLTMVPGKDIRSQVTSLANLLDTEPNLSVHNFSSSIASYGSGFANAQSAFNVIVNKLNTDPGTKFKNYLQSSGTVAFEVPIASIVTSAANTTSLITSVALPFLSGPMDVYYHITSTVVWAPAHFGDASSMKHVRESTIAFENMAFTAATAYYSSDLSTGFVGIPFNGEGPGAWGEFAWGQATWGGDGSSRPMRTYIPADKQRCRYISAKLVHATALEKYAVFGLSYTAELVSSRAYR